jgi:hypothetical protein
VANSAFVSPALVSHLYFLPVGAYGAMWTFADHAFIAAPLKSLDGCLAAGTVHTLMITHVRISFYIT